MITLNFYLIGIIFILIGAFVLESIASYLNLKSLTTQLPSEFSGWYDWDKYRKSQEYTKANTKLGIISSSVNLVLLLGFIFLGGFPWLDAIVRSWELPWLLTGLVYLGILILVQDFLNLPFELYRIFGLEESFGFNRMSAGTFVKDKLKGYMLMLCLGVPVISGILIFFQNFPHWGWLYAWLFIILVMLFLQYLAPTLILPLFNKFTPLEPGELRDKILDYAQRQGFNLSGIYVMDGSKRTTKSNAFFTGFGKRKRIAFFDTLVEKFTPEELVSILAHEVGHYKFRHIFKNMFFVIVKTAFLLYLLSLFISHPPLFEAFGLEHVSIYAGLIFFLLLYVPVSMLLTVIFNHFSRKFEYQADAFACQSTGQVKVLIDALKKLSVDNLSNLTPHWFYVILQYSHPPILDRIKALKELEKT